MHKLINFRRIGSCISKVSSTDGFSLASSFSHVISPSFPNTNTKLISSPFPTVGFP
ncbi:hypothetical protein [Clostridium celatum]|uniref:hypothetical protein n=1 Tax=Clostridium celatum TaxID=36834 RepID=UPI001F159978|nr:hypothetical protein [Clostridium celatum]